MGDDKRRYDGLVREFRKIMFGLCCALGALGGLWTAIWSSPEPKHPGHIGQELSEMLKPMLVHFGIGFGIGLAAGLLLCLTLLRPRDPDAVSRRARASSAPARPPSRTPSPS